MLEMDQSQHSDRRDSDSIDISNMEAQQQQQQVPASNDGNFTLAASDTDTASPETDSEDNWPALTVNIFNDWGSFLSLGYPEIIFVVRLRFEILHFRRCAWCVITVL